MLHFVGVFLSVCGFLVWWFGCVVLLIVLCGAFTYSLFVRFCMLWFGLVVLVGLLGCFVCWVCLWVACINCLLWLLCLCGWCWWCLLYCFSLYLVKNVWLGLVWVIFLLLCMGWLIVFCFDLRLIGFYVLLWCLPVCDLLSGLGCVDLIVCRMRLYGLLLVFTAAVGCAVNSVVVYVCNTFYFEN